jgi:hypothetical protein
VLRKFKHSDIKVLKRCLFANILRGLMAAAEHSSPCVSESDSLEIDLYCLPVQSTAPKLREDMLVKYFDLQHVEANSACLWNALHGAMLDAEILQASDEDPDIMKLCLLYMKEQPVKNRQDEESEGSMVPKFKEEFRNLLFKTKSGAQSTSLDINAFYKVSVFVFLGLSFFRK